MSAQVPADPWEGVRQRVWAEVMARWPGFVKLEPAKQSELRVLVLDYLTRRAEALRLGWLSTAGWSRLGPEDVARMRLPVVVVEGVGNKLAEVPSPVDGIIGEWVVDSPSDRSGQ